MLQLKCFQRLFSGVVLLCLLTFQASSQLLENYNAEVWLKPSFDPLESSLQEGLSIGNYGLLDCSDEQVRASLGKISRETSGTLFMVLRTTGNDTVGEDPLVDIGPVRLYPDRVSLDGREMDIEPVGQEARIVRCYYQGRLKRYYRSKPVHIDPSVQLAEVIFYKNILDPAQARVVESYLAMKYSVNITANKKPDFRDYLDIYRNKAWNSKTDEDYDEEVLALGRFDRIDFYQSQTFTSDSRTIQFSLDDTSALGRMPGFEIGEKSLLLLDKKEEKSNTTNGCGAAPFSHPWKMKFIGWQSPATNAYLTLDTVLTSFESPSLTDGNISLPLETKIIGTKTLITIPLPSDSITTATFYISWGNNATNCSPFCRVRLPDCNPFQEMSGSVQLKIQRQALPAEVSLVNLRSSEKLRVTVDDENSVIENLSAGQYHLRVKNSDIELADEVFVFEGCPGDHPTGDSTSLRVLGNGPGTNGDANNAKPAGPDDEDLYSRNGDAEQRILAFPNPAARGNEVSFRFINLHGQAFKIEIIDPRGKLLALKDFTPDHSIPVFLHTFTTDGSYIIRITSDNFTDTKHIIIN